MAMEVEEATLGTRRRVAERVDVREDIGEEVGEVDDEPDDEAEEVDRSRRGGDDSADGVGRRTSARLSVT